MRKMPYILENQMRYLYSWEFILVFKNKCGKDDAFEIGEKSTFVYSSLVNH